MTNIQGTRKRVYDLIWMTAASDVCNQNDKVTAKVRQFLFRITPDVANRLLRRYAFQGLRDALRLYNSIFCKSTSIILPWTFVISSVFFSVLYLVTIKSDF